MKKIICLLMLLFCLVTEAEAAKVKVGGRICLSMDRPGYFSGGQNVCLLSYLAQLSGI